MRRKHSKENDGQPSAKIAALIQKLRQAQAKHVDQMSQKWGFDFTHMAPATKTSPVLTQQNKVGESEVPEEDKKNKDAAEHVSPE